MVRAFKWEPIYSLHPPDISTCILQVSAKLQSSDGNQFYNRYQSFKLNHFLNPTVCILWAGTKIQLTNLYSLHTSDRGQDATWIMLQTPPCQSIVVYFSCCCGCIQSWFASLVYAVQAVMTSLDDLQKFTQWVNLPFSPGIYVYSSLCFFSPSPSLLQTRYTILERTTTHQRSGTTAPTQCCLHQDWCTIGCTDNMRGSVEKGDKCFISSKRSKVNKPIHCITQ